MSSYDNNSDKNGLLVGLIIILLCVAGFAWWYMKNMDDPAANDAELLKEEGDIELSGTCYFYEQLSDEAKQAYKFIYRGCMAFEEEIRIPSTSSDECNKAIYALRADHPEFFWIRSNTVSITYINDVAVSVSCTVPSDAGKKMKRIESIADEILKDAPKNEYDKIKYIYEYIINSTDYDLKGIDDPENQNIYRTLVDHLAVCGGYANTFLYLCDKAGIYCGYASGEVKGRGPHAWNFVKLGGKFYWVDVTWGDPVFEGSIYSEEGNGPRDNMSYDYFMVDDKEILSDRILSNSPSYSAYQPYMDFTYPKCTDASRNYYASNGCYFKGYNRLAVYDYILTQVGAFGNMKVTLKFDTTEAYREAKSDIFDTDEFLSELANDLYDSYDVNISQQMVRMSEDARRMVIEFS
ncbi:MAG: hypothetical protein IKS98_12750 [Lachnospiraceae bacterium]|nr:hypothetical protein [Lachnospiraceae bacterium]